MLIAGGLDLTNRPQSAFKYADYLPTIGFEKVAEIKGKAVQSEWTTENAKQGDVAVMNHGEHGHICFYDGKKWVSDFIQNNMWVYSGDGTCKIFRFHNENELT